MDRNIFKSRSIGAHLTAGADTLVYTCPNNYTAHVELLFVANLGSGNQTITIQWYDQHKDETYFIVGGYVVSGYNYLKLDGSYLTLNAGDTLTFHAPVGSTMDATITVEEFYDPSSRQ